MTLMDVPLDSLRSFLGYCDPATTDCVEEKNKTCYWTGPHWMTLTIVEGILYDRENPENAQNPDFNKKQWIFTLMSEALEQEFSEKQGEILATVHRINGLTEHFIKVEKPSGYEKPRVYLVAP